jgi:hypothetical protein
MLQQGADGVAGCFIQSKGDSRTGAGAGAGILEYFCYNVCNCGRAVIRHVSPPSWICPSDHLEGTNRKVFTLSFKKFLTKILFPLVPSKHIVFSKELYTISV